MKTYIVLLWAMFVIAPLQAQNCDLEFKGRLIDYHNGKPLSGALVKAAKGGTLITNAKGEFTLSALCEGLLKLEVSHIDCETQHLSFDLTASIHKVIYMEHHIDELQEVNIVADVHEDGQISSQSISIKKEAIDRYSGQTLGDVLEDIAGVQSLKTGTAVVKPVIHGMHSSRVAIVQNGMRQSDQEWGVEHAPNIDLNTAQSIEVVRGPQALRYGGDAIGGTVILKPKRVIKKDTLIGSIIVNGQSNGRGGSLIAQYDKYYKSGWYHHGTLTAKRLGDYHAPDYVLSNTGSQTLALSAGAGYKEFVKGIDIKYQVYQSAIGILRSSHNGSAADLERNINLGLPGVINDFTYDIAAPRQEVTHHSLQLNSFYRLRELGKLEGHYSLQFNQRKEYDIRRGERRDIPALDMDLLTQNAQLFLHIDKWTDWELQTGIDGQYQINTPNPDTGVRRLIPDYKSLKLGLFANASFKTNSDWGVQLGARYDRVHMDAQKFYQTSRWEERGYDQRYDRLVVEEFANQVLTNPVFNFDLWSASLEVKKEWQEQLDASVLLSHAQRAPNVGELFSDGLHHALATIELGSLDLVKEQSNKLSAAIHYQRYKWDIELQSFAQHVSNFMQLLPTGVENTTRGTFPVYEYTQNDAMWYGVDLGYRYDHWVARSNPKGSDPSISMVKTAWSLSGSLSYVHATNLNDDTPVFEIPPLRIKNTLEKPNLFVNGLRLGVTHDWVFRQNRFSDLNYNIRVLNDQGQFEERELNISQTPDGYHLIHAYAAYSLHNTSVRLGVDNLFNTSYRSLMNRQRFFADDLGRNITLQITYKL